MKVNIFIAVAVGVLTYALTLYFNHSERPNIIVQPDASVLIEPQQGELAPDFSFTDIRGEEHSLRDFDGQIVLLNFWASWCAPCIKEFPILIDLVKMNENENVHLLALSADIDKAAMMRFVERFRAQGLEIDHDRVHVALDENSHVMKSIYQTYKLPETYIIAPDSKLTDKLVGADWAQEDVQDIISSLK